MSLAFEVDDRVAVRHAHLGEVEHVCAALAIELVVAGAAGNDVVALVAGDEVVQRVAGRIDIVATRQTQVFDRALTAKVEGDRGPDRVIAATGDFSNDLVADIVDDICVIAVACVVGVRAGAAVKEIAVAATRMDDVVAGSVLMTLRRLLPHTSLFRSLPVAT